jgi:hypothetical protein
MLAVAGTLSRSYSSTATTSIRRSALVLGFHEVLL